jgi:7-cyano-7-deazaguanine synthase
MGAASVGNAVVLLSGGVDSATTLAMAVEEGYHVHALTIRYGQRHELEIDAARRVARSLKVAAHAVVDIDLRAFGGSALTDNIAVPKDRNVQRATDIPPTYVPARNTIFLSMALAWAEVIPAAHIFIGANALDYSGYPDCRPEFIAAFERLANLATKAGVTTKIRFQIHAPLMQMTKREIVQRGTALGVNYALTMSCYDPDSSGLACGRCDACQLRLRGFVEAGIEDPATYQVAVPA